MNAQAKCMECSWTDGPAKDTPQSRKRLHESGAQHAQLTEHVVSVPKVGVFGKGKTENVGGKAQP